MNKFGFDTIKEVYAEVLKSGKDLATERTLDDYINVYAVTMLSALFPDAATDEDEITEAWELIGYLRPQG